jgi:hypothetical protein
MPAVEYGLRHDPFGFDPWEDTAVPDEGRGSARPVLARPVPLESLIRELRRYRAGQVKGRNCLLAGPRGSGKTTIIEAAHDEVSTNSDGRLCRLIRVRLHGPSLLKDAAAEEGGDDALNEHVLKIVLVNLYQTLCEELANAYKEFAVRHGPEGLEMAAQLRLMLDGAPDAAPIRQFWDAVGALPGGVLGVFAQPGDIGYAPDQGVAEIVALATTSKAYRSCTAKDYKVTTTEQDSAGSKSEVTEKVDANGSELRQMIISAVAGIGVAASAQYGGFAPSAATIAGAVTALLSLCTFSFSNSRTREKSTKAEVTFLPDLSVASLVHRAPLILRRLRQAGVAPIFIVDELDKISDLPERLTKVVSSLKFLTADAAFFCFLTNRAYIAKMYALNRDGIDRVERTIFTDWLFLTYSPAQLHRFLSDVIRPSGMMPDPQTAEEFRADAEALRYILINRARMLPFELVRAIGELRDGDGWLNLSKGDPRKIRVYKFHLMVQLAIEVVLTSQFVTERIDRDPDFAQTIYDALYYPTNRWYAGDRRLDCSANAIVTGLAAETEHAAPISDEDSEFLHERVAKLVKLIANPKLLIAELKSAFDEKRMTTSLEVRQAIPETSTLLEPVEGSPDVYEWIYNRYGIPHEAADVSEIVESPELRDAADVISGIEAGLQRLDWRASVAQILAMTTSTLHELQLLASFELPG